MGRISLLFIPFLLIVLSCEKDFSSIDQSQGSIPDPSIYIGKIGTKRVYKNTVRIFKPYSKIPYVAIPDSLKNRVTLSDSLINQGYVIIGEIEETLTPMFPSNYELWNLPYPYEEYKKLEGESNGYDLSDEIKCLIEGREYEGSHQSISGGVYYENPYSVVIVLGKYPNWLWVKKPLYVNSEWIREYREYKNERGITERFQREAKVVGEELIKIEAGTYSAFKVEIKFHWVDLNAETIARYEYYVPNIGLVLEESDNHHYSTVFNLDGSSTTVFRRYISRKELKSYNIVME